MPQGSAHIIVEYRAGAVSSFLVKGDMCHHNIAKGDHGQFEEVRFLTCSQLVETLIAVHAAHEILLHDVIVVCHAPIVDDQVWLAIHLLEDGVLQGLVKHLYITDRVMLMRDARL